jgi:sugar phosphate isomerase/epimerase
MFDDTPELLRRVAENLKDINNFGVCLDLAHAFLSKVDLKQWVDELSPYVKHIHINDNDKQQDLHLPVGSGQMDWSILGSEKLFASSPSVLIEVSGKEKLIKSIDYLKGINFL